MPDITIQGSLVDFPNSAAEPNWAEAVIQFAELTATALSGLVGAGDVSPQIYTMVADTNSDVDLPSLQFATSVVRAATINYSVYRTTNTGNAAESGMLQLIYNPNNAPTQKWEFTQQKVGEGDITFTVLDTGQVQFSSTALGGSDHVGKITYYAKALLQS